jgi:hypothetical protein
MLKRSKQPCRDRNNAGCECFGVHCPNRDDTGIKVYVSPFHGHHLTAPHSSVECADDQGPKLSAGLSGPQTSIRRDSSDSKSYGHIIGGRFHLITPLLTLSAARSISSLFGAWRCVYGARSALSLSSIPMEAIAKCAHREHGRQIGRISVGTHLRYLMLLMKRELNL